MQNAGELKTIFGDSSNHIKNVMAKLKTRSEHGNEYYLFKEFCGRTLTRGLTGRFSSNLFTYNTD